MRIQGNATLNADAARVWSALNDPQVLVRTIPGCEQLEAITAERYRMTITAGVASIKGTYLGDVELADQQPPGAFTLRASGAGAPGTVNAEVKVTLADNGDGTTLLRYDADAVVGGAVGGVGQRVLTGVAKKTAGEFFQAVDAVLTGEPVLGVPPVELSGLNGQPPAPAPAAEVAAEEVAARAAKAAAPVLPSPTAPTTPTAPAVQSTPAAPLASAAPAAPRPGQVFTRPAPPPGAVRRSQREQLTAVLIGALIALIGVWIGWRLARRNH